MAKLPHLKLKAAVLILLAGLVVLLLLAAFQPVSAGSYAIYLPLVNAPATLEHGGLHPWPHPTITPVPEAAEGGGR